MEITVTQKRENALLDRTEVHFTIAHPEAGTPTRTEIKKALAGSLNMEGVLVLDWARSEFGRTSTRGYAKMYPSKERAIALETPPVLIRNGLLQKVAKTAEATPKEAAPAPRKREAKKEAPKPEAPKKEAPPKDEKKEAAKPHAKEEAPKAEKKEAAKKEEPKEKKPAAKKEGK
ncbi:MAG: hypothetical protein AABY30_05870 [Candidatus Thermoplasmatota archaeon]